MHFLFLLATHIMHFGTLLAKFYEQLLLLANLLLLTAIHLLSVIIGTWSTCCLYLCWGSALSKCLGYKVVL